MSLPFEVVKLYREDIYSSWTANKPKVEHWLEEAYFIKVDGMYFFLGDEYLAYCVEEE